METLSAIATRSSTREFSPTDLSKEDLQIIVDAGRRAPSARAVEPWEFVVVQEKATLAEVGGLCPNGKFLQDAACCIAIFCNDTKYYLEDGCAATENMLLAATDLGIACCWVAGDKKPYCAQINALLKAPQSLKLVSLIALGYAKESPPQQQKRRTLTQVLHWEHF